MEREVTIDQEYLIFVNNTPILLLKDKSSGSALPVWMGTAEAGAILAELQGVQPLRPMTHDLFKNVLTTCAIMVKKVVVTELKDTIYHAVLILEKDGEEMRIDTRPSDGIALALRFGSPIFVEDTVFVETMQDENTKGLLDTFETILEQAKEQRPPEE